MAETWRIHDDVPRGLAVTDAESLEPERFAQLAKIVHEEAERYPPPFIERLPPLLLLRSARLDGEPIRARYFTPQRVAVVTPTLDLRGNLHRLVATDLLQTFPDRAQALLQACAAARSDLLYQGRLGVDGEGLVAHDVQPQAQRLVGEHRVGAGRGGDRHRLRAGVDEGAQVVDGGDARVVLGELGAPVGAGRDDTDEVELGRAGDERGVEGAAAEAVADQADADGLGHGGLLRCGWNAYSAVAGESSS